MLQAIVPSPLRNCSNYTLSISCACTVCSFDLHRGVLTLKCTWIRSFQHIISISLFRLKSLFQNIKYTNLMRKPKVWVLQFFGNVRACIISVVFWSQYIDLLNAILGFTKWGFGCKGLVIHFFPWRILLYKYVQCTHVSWIKREWIQSTKLSLAPNPKVTTFVLLLHPKKKYSYPKWGVRILTR
jgi:hypothetical protein